MQDFEIEKTQYTIILNQAISLTESYILKLPELSIYKIILEQLLYVKGIIIDQNRKPTEEEVTLLLSEQLLLKTLMRMTSLIKHY